MYFVRKSLNNEITGASATVYLPDPEQTEPNLGQRQFATEVEISGEKRDMLTQPLRMMMAFNQDYAGRLLLAHDCHVFALACRTDDDQRGVSYDLENGGASVKTSGYEFTRGIQEPDAQAGDIIFVRDAPPDDPLEFSLAARHVMVKASVDDKKPLYLSKLGINAAVAVHNFDTVAEFYNAQSAGIIRDISRVDPR